MLYARALGLSEAKLGYCAKAAPATAVKQREWIKQLVGDVSQKTLAEVRHSPEYRQAYDSETGFIATVQSHNIHRLCSEPRSGSR